MLIVQNSTGGRNVTLKKFEGKVLRSQLSIPESAIVLRETTVYYDVATRRQFVVTTEADGLHKGCLHGKQL